MFKEFLLRFFFSCNYIFFVWLDWHPGICPRLMFFFFFFFVFSIFLIVMSNLYFLYPSNMPIHSPKYSVQNCCLVEILTFLYFIYHCLDGTRYLVYLAACPQVILPLFLDIEPLISTVDVLIPLLIKCRIQSHLLSLIQCQIKRSSTKWMLVRCKTSSLYFLWFN